MKTLIGLMVTGLLVILVVALVSKSVPTGEIVAKPVGVCKEGETKDVKQVTGAYGVKLFEYSVCSDGAWTGPHVASNLPG